MSAPSSSVKRLLRIARAVASNTRAATAVEYGLIVTLIVIASIAALIQVAGTTGEMWNNVNNKVTTAR